MLVVTRRINQAVIIADEIEVVVLTIRDEKISLGVQAPHDVAIFRKEIHHDGQPSLATAMDRYAEMRSGGSRQFTERTWTP